MLLEDGGVRSPAGNRRRRSFTTALMREVPLRMCIIAASADAVRVVCEACGSHRVIEKQRLGPAVLCSTCDEVRLVNDRRRRDVGHRRERRVTRVTV